MYTHKFMTNRLNFSIEKKYYILRYEFELEEWIFLIYSHLSDTIL